MLRSRYEGVHLPCLFEPPLITLQTEVPHPGFQVRPPSERDFDTVRDRCRVERIDDHTVKVMFKKPTPFWFEAFCGQNRALIPRHLFAAYKGGKSREAPTNLKPVGTGPYKFVDFKPGDLIRAEINMDYHVPNQPHFDARARRDWQSYEAYNAAFADALGADFGDPPHHEPRRSTGVRIVVHDDEAATALDPSSEA